MPLSRRRFLSTASTAAAALAAKDFGFAKGAARSRGRVLVGLAAPNYFSGFNPFLNWWKIASAPTLVRSSGPDLFGQEIWDHEGYLDPSTGEIVNPAPTDLLAISRVFYKSANSRQVAEGCSYAGEEWIAKWDGTAEGRIASLTAGGTQIASGSNQVNFTTGKDPDRVALVLTLTDRNDPPSMTAGILQLVACWRGDVARCPSDPPAVPTVIAASR